MLLPLLTALSLVLTPVSMLHAHVDIGGEHVVVHGGHSHEFDHHHDHHAGHDAPQWSGDHPDFMHAGLGDCNTTAVVPLDTDTDHLLTYQLSKGAVTVCRGLPDQQAVSRQGQSFITVAGVLTPRTHLHPPLRGPPVIIPSAI